MGANHPPARPASPRVRNALAATVIPLFALTLVATALLWPRAAQPATQADPVTRYDGTVRTVVEQQCPAPTPGEQDTPGLNTGPCGTVTVRMADGPDAGKDVSTAIPSGPGAPTVDVGDDVVLIQLSDPADQTATSYTIVDHQRGQPLILVALLFAAAIIAFGRLRGIAALAGLAASFAILLTFVLPAIRAGEQPLAVAIVGSALIMFVVLYLTHGVTTQTSVAVLGTLGSLVLTGVLGSLATGATFLTGYGSEEASTLALYMGDIDLHGLLLAGIIIGSLGVLDDVTVTQAATVTELAAANPGLSRLQLYRAATRVGRAHIASTVNTIVLAYAGASLPVLLLIIASGTGVATTLTTEFIAQEIVRSAVGTMGLIAAVPITTALAAFTATAGGARPAALARATRHGARHASGRRRQEPWTALGQGSVTDPWRGDEEPPTP